MPLPTAVFSLPLHQRKPGFELLHALADQPPVGFQLGFTRTAQSDAPFLTL